MHKSRFRFIKQSYLKELVERPVEVNQEFALDLDPEYLSKAKTICVFNGKGILLGMYKTKQLAADVHSVSTATIRKYCKSRKFYESGDRYFIEYRTMQQFFKGLPMINQCYNVVPILQTINPRMEKNDNNNRTKGNTKSNTTEAVNSSAA